jgi:hypothetical protein
MFKNWTKTKGYLSKVQLAILIILLLLIILLVSGCSNLPQEEGKVWVQKSLTQCAEEWQHDEYYSAIGKSMGEERINKKTDFIIEFYSKKEIMVYEIKYMDPWGPGSACEACTCLSGYELYLWIDEIDQDYFINLGFE